MSDLSSKTIEPCATVRGVLRMPGDKSVSHRVAMLGGVAEGVSTVTGFLRSEDCLNTLKAMQALGAGVEDDGARIRIAGTGGRLSPPVGELDMGNSGTGMRLLAGLLAGQSFETVMTGDASLRSRPMKRVKAPLEEMNAKIELLGEGGCAPIRVSGGNLQTMTYAPPVASAQVKSLVLLAGLYAEGTTTVVESKPTRDHTELMLETMGADVTREGLTVAVSSSGVPKLRAGAYEVPGDFSSAAFWLAAAAMGPGRDVTIEGVGLNPRRTAFLDVLRRMGADVTVTPDGVGWEPRGSVRVRGGGLRGTTVEGEEIPNLVDELPLVAVLGCMAEGETRIKDARELRVKESDRIATVAGNLCALGVDVEEWEDGMTVRGPVRIPGGVSLPGYGDHRVVMAMSVLALCAESPVAVEGVACVDTSYPEFWQDLRKLTA